MSHSPNEFYDAKFYDSQMAGSMASAAAVVPYVLALFPHVKSVVDIGCGAGTWLHVFAQYGMDIMGYDFGIAAKEKLVISEDSFMECDLREPIELTRKYDLAVSLEVGEHMEAGAADTLVDTLTSASDIVLFSAARPGQGGKNHINCQWPAWWRDKFAIHGFSAYDILRPVFWRVPSIKAWYRQNMILYIKNLENSGGIDFGRLANLPDFGCMPLIHPTWYNLMP